MILEGGIRCPCVVRYPGFNVPKGGAITQAFTTVMDILPTILELGGVPHPSPSFRGRDIMALRGKSWKQHLSSFDGDSLVINLEESSVHPAETHIHGWELFGERGIRDGPYKAVWMPPPRGAGTWQLFNVKDDPSELHDLGKKMPDRLASMVRHWETYCAETGLVEFSGPWFPEGI